MAKRKIGQLAKKVPDSEKGALNGIKLVFIGTFDAISAAGGEKAAKKSGARTLYSHKIADVDFVVVGLDPPQKKLDEIAQHDVPTLSEKEFLKVLKTGELAKPVGDQRPADDGGESYEEDLEVEEEPAPKKVKAPTVTKTGNKKTSTREAQHTIPAGKPGALRGFKLMFTGTLNTTRETCIGAVETYGGNMVTKLEEADWIILGTKPGPANMQQIRNLGLRTMNEDEWLEWLASGEAPESD